MRMHAYGSSMSISLLCCMLNNTVFDVLCCCRDVRTCDSATKQRWL